MSDRPRDLEWAMILSKAEILLILERIGEQTVVDPTKRFPYRISTRGMGYSDDKQIGPLQAKLSIMLEMAAKAEGE